MFIQTQWYADRNELEILYTLTELDWVKFLNERHMSFFFKKNKHKIRIFKIEIIIFFFQISFWKLSALLLIKDLECD